MSVKVSTAVWEYSTMADAKLTLLLAIADIANDDGEAHPGRMKLAKKVRKSDRTVTRLLAEMVKTPEIVIEECAGPRGVNRYWIPILPKEPGYSPEPCTLAHTCNRMHHPLPDRDEKKSGRTPVPRVDTAMSTPRKKHARVDTAMSTPVDTAMSTPVDTAVSTPVDTAMSNEPSGNVSYTSVDVRNRVLTAQNGRVRQSPEPAPDPPPLRGAPPTPDDGEPMTRPAFMVWFREQYRARNGFEPRASVAELSYNRYRRGCSAVEAMEEA